jgi:hypothetical protein
MFKDPISELPDTFSFYLIWCIDKIFKITTTSTSNEASPVAALQSDKSTSLAKSKSSNKPRARRRASGLGGELWGDTGAPAFATLDLWRDDDMKVS